MLCIVEWPLWLDCVHYTMGLGKLLIQCYMCHGILKDQKHDKASMCTGELPTVLNVIGWPALKASAHICELLIQP